MLFQDQKYLNKFNGSGEIKMTILKNKLTLIHYYPGYIMMFPKL